MAINLEEEMTKRVLNVDMISEGIIVVKVNTIDLATASAIMPRSKKKLKGQIYLLNLPDSAGLQVHFMMHNLRLYRIACPLCHHSTAATTMGLSWAILL